MNETTNVPTQYMERDGKVLGVSLTEDNRVEIQSMESRQCVYIETRLDRYGKECGLTLTNEEFELKHADNMDIVVEAAVAYLYGES